MKGIWQEPWKKWAAMCMRVWAWHLDPTKSSVSQTALASASLYMLKNYWESQRLFFTWVITTDISYIRNLSWEFLIFTDSLKIIIINPLNAAVFNLLQSVILVKICKENSASHRDVIENRRTILVSFSNNYGYYTLILHQNSTSVFFKG